MHAEQKIKSLRFHPQLRLAHDVASDTLSDILGETTAPSFLPLPLLGVGVDAHVGDSLDLTPRLGDPLEQGHGVGDATPAGQLAE